MLADFQHRMNIDAEYQRGKVWSTGQQALLIDSILRGFAIPTIYVRKAPDGSPYLFDVIDGKQRLTAIWQFLSDDIRLLRAAQEFPEFGDLRGRCWSELSAAAQDRLQFTSITIAQLDDATDEEIREFFLRLQKGETLRAAERRNAVKGPIRDFVADSLSAHPLWDTTGINPKRLGLHEHSAIVLALVIARKPTAIKGADLHKLYEDRQFDPCGPDAQRTLHILDVLHEISKTKPQVLRTRWGLVDLTLTLLQDESEVFSSDPTRVMAFFEHFEQMRRDTALKLADFQTKVVEITLEDDEKKEALEQLDVPADILGYHMAFSREGASVENITTRLGVMSDRLRQYWSDPER